jgi:hypothetical protein
MAIYMNAEIMATGNLGWEYNTYKKRLSIQVKMKDNETIEECTNRVFNAILDGSIADKITYEYPSYLDTKLRTPDRAVIMFEE